MEEHTDISDFSNSADNFDTLNTLNTIKTINICVIVVLGVIIHQYTQTNTQSHMVCNLIYDLIYLFIIYVINVVREFINYQYTTYIFYNTHIFPFYKYLSSYEKTYISECLKYSIFELFRPFCQSFYHRLSFFSYSIKCSNNYINTSRLSYGSVIVPGLIYPSAKIVLNSRNIAEPIMIDDNVSFGGLGWDLYENIFKIYYRFNNYDNLPWIIKKMFNSIIDNYGQQTDLKSNQNMNNTNNMNNMSSLKLQYSNLKNPITFLEQGLISWSYKNNILFEIKLYQYDKNNISNTILFSVDPTGKHLRTDVQYNHQLNTDQSNTDQSNTDQPNTDQSNTKKIDKIPEYNKLNKKGQYILDLYEKHNYKLDTTNIIDKYNYTLYFPKL